MSDAPGENRWKRLPTLQRVPRKWGDPGPLVRLLADHDAKRTPNVRPIGDLTAKQFLQLLQQSGLVEDTAVAPRWSEWDAELASVGGLARATGIEVARRMVSARLLSVWQAEKLLSGKHKGFYLANYRIVDLLGITPWAAIYRAEHQLMRRAAVMEVLSDKLSVRDELRERFFRRARGVAELDHPNLVHVFDIGEERDMCYVVMEYVAGYDLRRFIRRLGPLPEDTAAGIVHQVGLGMLAVHAAGQTLEGLQPKGIMLDPNGVVHLLTLRLDVALADPGETPPGNDFPSSRVNPFLPDRPNQQCTSPQRDVYSLGVLLYYLLVGQPPPVASPTNPMGNVQAFEVPRDPLESPVVEPVDGGALPLDLWLTRERAQVDAELVEILRELTTNLESPHRGIADAVARLSQWLASTSE